MQWNDYYQALRSLRRRHAYYFGAIICISLFTIHGIHLIFTPGIPASPPENVASILRDDQPVGFILPVYHPSILVTSTFGERAASRGYRKHRGIDLAPIGGGTPDILAAERGVVVFAGRRSGYGNTVELYHRDGSWTRYAHLSRLMTKTGNIVGRGQVIGVMGNTGRVHGRTGVHLHFEYVTHDGTAKEPKILGYASLPLRKRLDYNTSYYAIYASAQPHTRGLSSVSLAALSAAR